MVSARLLAAAGSLLLAVHPASAAFPTVRDILEAKSIDAIVPSPDGRQVAYRVIERSDRDDSTIVQWYVVSTAKPGPPVALGSPGIPEWIPLADVVDRPKAEWLPDGSALLAIQSGEHGSQLHLMAPAQSDRQVTDDKKDVVDFRLSTAGLEVETGSAWTSIAEIDNREQRDGIHLDVSIPTEGLRLTGNFTIGTRVTTIRRTPDGSVDEFGSIRSGWKVIASPYEREAGPARRRAGDLLSYSKADSSLDGKVIDLGGDTRLRFVVTNKPQGAEEEAVDRLEAVASDGTVFTCDAPFCVGPSSSYRQILFDRRAESWVITYEPDGSGQTNIYAWTPRSAKVRIVWSGSHRLRGGSDEQPAPCPIVGNSLICVDAAPTRPDRLVSLDLLSRKMRLLADPNSDFDRFSLPETRSLTWSDAHGQQTRGVLVLPKTDGPVPLVITTYRCGGFLQGATSKLTPEIALAARGIAALCINNNNQSGHQVGRDGREAFFGEQDAALDSYAAIIAQLSRANIIDPSRVGIAGHSFTGNLVGYALVKSSLFAAAEIGSGLTIDPMSYYLTSPIANSWRKVAIFANGLPAPDRDPKGLWSKVSPALNAGKIMAPLLIQAPEVEYLMALQLYGALDDLNKPVDMYIYPAAGHMVGKSPAQMISRAERSVDWFSFWLLPAWRTQNSERVTELGWDKLRHRRDTPNQTSPVSPMASPVGIGGH